MKRSSNVGVAAGIGGAVFVVLLAWSGGPEEAVSPGIPRDAPIVDAHRVATALASERPPRITLSDEVEHFRARLVARGSEDRLARQRLISAHLLRFRAYGSTEDLEAARGHLAALEQLLPGDAGLVSTRASLQLLEHDFEGALASAREANRHSGDFDSPLRLRLFDALWATGDYQGASALLDQPHDSASFDFLVREARVLDRRGHPDAARDRLAAAVVEARAYAQPRAIVAWALVELGHHEHHSGGPEAAAQRYLEALEILPGGPGALEGLASLAAGVDRNFDAAISLYEAAIRNGGHLDAWLALADARESAGDAADAALAREAFLAGVSVSPEAEEQHRRPLALLLADHHPDRLEEARRLASDDLAARATSEAWDTIAWVEYRAGNVQKAWNAARRAIAWGAPEPIVLLHAGIIANAAGRSEEASVLLLEALSAPSELTVAEVYDAGAILDSIGLGSG